MVENKILFETQKGKPVWVKRKDIVLRISAYGIFARRGKVLVVQTHLALWEFPGGSPLQGEPLFDALKREFKEETGFEIEPQKLILERESFYFTPKSRAYHSFQNFFTVSGVSRGDIDSYINLTRATWIDLNELSEENMNRGAYIALKTYKEQKKSSVYLPPKMSK